MFVPILSATAVSPTRMPSSASEACHSAVHTEPSHCELLSYEEAAWQTLIKIGMLGNDGKLTYEAQAIFATANVPASATFLQLSAAYIKEKSLPESLLDDNFSALSPRQFLSKSPLFTVEEQENDCYQNTVDQALKILRYVRQPASDHDWAVTALYLSFGFIFAAECPKISSISQKALHAIADDSDKLAIAFAASGLTSKAIWLPCDESDSPFFAEIYRLLFETSVPFPVVEAALCFAAWVRACHLSSNWHRQSQIDISIRQQRYFVLHHRDRVLMIAIKPQYYSSLLLEAEDKDLNELRTLWQIIIPSEIEEKLSKTPLMGAFSNSLALTESFSACARKFIERKSPFLNQAGLTCIMAVQGIYKRPFGLDPVFGRLHSLLNNGSMRSLRLLSSFLNSSEIFFEKEPDLAVFIDYLISTKHRFYGRSVLASIPTEERAEVLYKLLPRILKNSPSEAALFFRTNAALLDQKFSLPFFFSLAEETEGDILPDLLELGCTLLSSCEPGNLDQKAFMKLLQNAIARGLCDSATSLILAACGHLQTEIWEEAISLLCKRLEKPILILKAWETLSSKRMILYRPAIFEELKLIEGEKFDLSENFISSLDPVQAITAISSNWCQNIAIERRKSLIKDALLALLKENDEKILLNVFSSYVFTIKNCDLPALQEALLEYFKEDLPSGCEIARIHYLLKLSTTKAALPFQERLGAILTKHLEHIATLPKQGVQVMPILGEATLDYSFKSKTENEIELLFSFFKAELKKKHFDLQTGISLLIAFIPLLVNKSETSEILFSLLKGCNAEAIQPHFGAIIKAFGRKKEGLDYLLSLPNCTKLQVFSAAREHLFPHLSEEKQLEIWSEQAKDLQELAAAAKAPQKKTKRRRPRKRKGISKPNSNQSQVQMLEYFSDALEKSLIANIPLVQILEAMRNAHYWPEKIMHLAARSYPVEAIFELLWKMDQKGEFNAATDQKKEYFKFFFNSLMHSPYLRTLLKDLKEVETLFHENERDVLIAKYLEAVLPLMGFSTTEELSTLSLLRLRVSSLPPESDILLIGMFLDSSNKELIEHAFTLAILLLSNPPITPDILESIQPLAARMAAPPVEAPSLEKFLLFSQLAYVYFPGKFENDTKKFVFEKILELCSHREIPAIQSEEALLPLLFAYLIENPTRTSLTLCEHYLVFCDSFSAKSRHELHLLLTRAKMRLPGSVNDGKCIVKALDYFEQTLRLFFNNDDSANEESTSEDNSQLLNLFRTTVDEAFCLLVKLAFYPEHHELFLKKFVDIFSQLEVMHEQDEEETKRYYMQGFYLNLIEKLLHSSESFFDIGFVLACFTTHLLPIDNRHAQKFINCLTECIFALLTLEPIENLNFYREVQHLIMTLQRTSNNLALPKDILRLALILEHVIAYAIGDSHPFNYQIRNAISSLLNSSGRPTAAFCTNSFIILRRVQLLVRPEYPNFFSKCTQAFLSKLKYIPFEEAVNLIEKSGLEFSYTAHTFTAYKEAIFAIIKEAVQSKNESSYQAIHDFILHLHSQQKLDKPSLLDCYKMFFASWRHLPVEAAFCNTQKFCETFLQQNLKIQFGKFPAIDYQLPYLIFLQFFNIAIVNHGFPKQSAAYVFQAAYFLIDLHRNSFFDKHPGLFIRSIRSLAPLQNSQLESADDLGHLNLTLTYVVENAENIEDETLFAIFEYLNMHIAYAKPHSNDILETIHYFLNRTEAAKLFGAKPPFLQTLGKLYIRVAALALEKEGSDNGIEDLLASLFTNLRENSVTEKDLSVTFSFLNSCIALMPHTIGRPILNLVIQNLDNLVRTSFPRQADLYFRLIKLLGTCNLQITKDQYDAFPQTQIQDYFLEGLLGYNPEDLSEKENEGASTLEALEQKVAVFSWYSEELSSLSPNSIPQQCLLLSSARNHLSYHLELADTEKAFLSVMELIKPLLSANAKLINAQLAKEQGAFDYGRTILASMLFNKSKLLNPAIIKTSIGLAAYYAVCFKDLDIPDRVREQIRFGTNTILKFFQNGFFDATPGLFFELLSPFIPCQVFLDQRELESEGSIVSENHFYGRLMDHILEENTHFLTDSAMSSKLSVLRAYFKELSKLAIENSDHKKLLIALLEKLLGQYSTLLKRHFEENHERGPCFPFYIENISEIISCNAALIRLQNEVGLPCCNLLNDLLYHPLANESFNQEAYKGKRNKLVLKYSNLLIALNQLPANEIACDMLKKIDTK